MDARLTDGFAPLEQYDLKSFQRDLRSLSEPINLDIDRYRAGTWTDVYALAATLYVLLTNNQPIPATWRKVSPESFTPPQKHNPNISDRTNAAILKGMEIEPENRSQSVAEWLDLLNSAQKKNTKVRAVKENIIRVFQFDMIKINNRGEIIKTEHNSAKYFSENLGNGITLDMVSIPGGSFMMGTANSEIEKLVKKYNSDWFRRESPQHEVTVTEFYIGKFQITQEQWKQVSKLPQVERELKKYPSHFPKAKLPVEKVSWYDAVEFCARLSKATGKEYRLPSEVEWEYACRARTATPFYFGETITGNLANYDASYTYANEVSAEYRGETTLVGSFLPNQFGLYEMHGNVWEWCADNYHENYDGAPSDSHAWISEYTTTRILRGGSWLNVSGYCRSANRTRNAPDILYNNCGFRCVMSH
jgi:formylglycine-generating enzyme required for sulfatase activity